MCTAPIDVSKLNTDQPYNVDVVEDHSLLTDRRDILGSKSDLHQYRLRQ